MNKNSSLILRIKQEALGAATFEAFLEAAPQLILQSSIVLRTGNISKCLFLMSNFFTISHPLAKQPFVFVLKLWHFLVLCASNGSLCPVIFLPKF